MQKRMLKNLFCKISVICFLVVFSLFCSGDVSAATKPALSKKSITITAGMKQTLIVKNQAKKATVKWSSSAKNIATVSSKGVITGVSDGAATVTCKVTQGGKTYSLKATVTVATPVLSGTDFVLVKGGDTEKLKVKNARISGTTITYSSSDKTIVKVSSAGTLTAVGPGDATATAKVVIPKSGSRTKVTISLKAKVTVLDDMSAVMNSSKTDREVISLNGKWKFTDHKGDSSTVTVPHDWKHYDEFDNKNQLKASVTATYSKTVDVSGLEGKEIFIRFGAVNKVAKVYVDDQLIGTHTGGFVAFAYDITKECKGKKEITIKVKNTNITYDTIPVSAGFMHISGMYRDVDLIAVNKASYISAEDAGSSGVYLKSSVDLKAGDATLNPNILISNPSSDKKQVVVKVSVKDAKGKEVAVSYKAKNIKAGKTNVSYAFKAMTIKDAHLWQGTTDPYLYTVDTTVCADGKVVDQNSQKTGFRQYSVKSGKFYLNGKKYLLKGMGMHQENRGGYVSAHKDIKETMDILTEMGCNAVRTSHYPHDPYTYELMDELGLVAYCEIPYYTMTIDSATFNKNAILSVEEMVKQYENHPSIIIWGIQNEVYYKKEREDTFNIASVSKTVKLMKQLAAKANEIDGTRFVGQALYNSKAYAQEQSSVWTKKGSGISTIGLNLYVGWYSGYGKTTSDYSAKILSKMKSKIKSYVTMFDDATGGTANYILTEYGAGANINQHTDMGAGFSWLGKDGTETAYGSHGDFHPEEFMNFCQESLVISIYGDKTKNIAPNSQIWAAFNWVLYDFHCYRHEGGTVLLNTKGVVTQDRKTKKDAFYLYKAIWNDKDYFTHIVSSRYKKRPTQTIDAKVYSNCDSVELVVNGTNLGKGKKQQDGVFVWKNVKLAAEGKENKVEAIGTKGGKTYKDSCDKWVYDK